MHFPARKGPNGGTATHLVTFFILGVIFAQKHAVLLLHRHRCGWLQMSLCGNYTAPLSGNHTVSLCGNHTVSSSGNHTVSLCANHTVSLCGNHTASLSSNHTEPAGGRAAGGGRRAGGRANSDATGVPPTPTAPTHRPLQRGDQGQLPEDPWPALRAQGFSWSLHSCRA